MLTCVTWNLQGGTASTSAIQRILEEGADVVFAQEAAESGDIVGKWYDFEGRFGTKSRSKGTYVGARRVWHSGYQGGTAIYLKGNLTLAGENPHFFSLHHPRDDEDKDRVYRGVAYVEIVLDQKSDADPNRLLLCTVHAWSPNGNDWDRIAKSLRSEIIKLADGKPVIVGGDFNAAAGRDEDFGTWVLPGPSHMIGGSLDGFWFQNVKGPHEKSVLNSAKGDHWPSRVQFKDIEPLRGNYK
jgi:endonuclease/exonuclease/phosphatase family metal-dependent hydrolase